MPSITMIQGPQVFPGTQDTSRFESIESLRRGLAIIFNKHDGLPSSLSCSHDDEKENKSAPTDEDVREFEAMLGGEEASITSTTPITTKVPSSLKKVLIKAPPRKPLAKIIPSRSIVPARAAAAITTAVKSAKVTTTTTTIIIADRELEGIHPLLLQMHPKTLAREAAREAAHQELERGKNRRRCFQYKIGKDTKKRTGNYRR